MLQQAHGDDSDGTHFSLMYVQQTEGVWLCASRVLSLAILLGTLLLLFQYRFHYREVHVTDNFILKYKHFLRSNFRMKNPHVLQHVISYLLCP